MASNLDCFLHCTTPVVQSQFLPKTEIRNLNRVWHPWERENMEYFSLSDIWNCYDEWSVYGAKVPITLSNGETLTQYYVPYLSAIQIFTGFRVETESGDGDSYSDCCSEESDSDKLWRWDGTGSSSSEDGGSEQESLLHQNDRLGYLYFQFFEKSTPYGRVPLLDKINGLARRFPGLMTLRSVDLSPASWMAVSWYPIYHIPMGRTIKDLSTCFLTYHTLSSSFQDIEMEEEGEMKRQRREAGEGIAVAAFGVATYKMQGSLWVSGNGGRDQERLVALSSVAESWLKQLRVQHHDFNYFTGLRHG
ncbi:uncharacterized protein LOC111468258 isoform X1 [Cucurbita maxima]|uniref:Uncharacterized protein LOC111468258 isoform X1 n=1 Tax=Cucurbita maxima TaxID=3661 RepID=A0A6J1HZ89_CUCMA|nr:uncharacterized protein LOC111468258 isoform X1 [Cucurbita maxima]